MESPVNFPPQHERLGVREHTRPACRFDQLSSARASVVHRRNEFGFLPARAIIAKPLLREAYTRDAYAPLLCRGISWACAGNVPPPQTEPHLQKPFQGAAKALQ